jgi:hypothetical protein
MARRYRCGGRPALRRALLAVTLATGCNPLFGIREGQVRPVCMGADSGLLIDDMEDGDGFICDANGRHGHWTTFSDGSSTDLRPGGEFNPTLIEDGKRGNSRYAARLTGSGFGSYAGMGFDLHQEDLARRTYDASTADGIKFWMKSTVPVDVAFATPETFLPSSGGQCKDTATEFNCERPFVFQITTPTVDWGEYQVPFSALRQAPGGSATWNPRNLFSIGFAAPPVVAFDVWVDDIRFYGCGATCLPTCTDPVFPVACPATGGSPARCVPPGVDCAVGCNPSNTLLAPASGLITTFDGAGGGVDITSVIAEVPIGPAGSAPTVTTDGALHISLNAPATSARQVFLVDFGFKSCIDATAFTGVQFGISGSFSGCELIQATQDSPHLHAGGSASAPFRYGSGPPGARPNGTSLAPAQITAKSQTLMMPFATQTGGVPATPIDRSKLVILVWVFRLDPYSAGGPTACVADLTIDDVRFY